MRNQDWQRLEAWDSKYYLHTEFAHDELHFEPIDHGEGSYIVGPDGKRWLDFLGQLLCIGVGQGVKEIRAAIEGALDRFGFVWDTTSPITVLDCPAP